MCMAAVGAVAGIMGSIVQYQAAQEDYEAKAAAWRQNVVNSQAVARDEQRQLLTRQMQESEKSAQSKHVSYIESAQKAAEAEVAGIAGGVGGISVDNLVDDIENKGRLNRTYADTNYRYVVQQTQEELTGTVTRMQNRIDAMPKPRSPNPAMLLVGILGAGARMGGGMMGG